MRFQALPLEKCVPDGCKGDIQMTDIEVLYRPVQALSDPASFYPGFKQQTVILPKGSTYGPGEPFERGAGSRWHGGTRPLPCDILFEQDVAVQMRDGTTIYVDIYRPVDGTDMPAIIGWSPYGKQGGFFTHALGSYGYAAPLDWIS